MRVGIDVFSDDFSIYHKHIYNNIYKGSMQKCVVQNRMADINANMDAFE